MRYFGTVLSVWICCGLLSVFPALSAAQAAESTYAEQASAAWQRGDFAVAISAWEQHLAQLRQAQEGAGQQAAVLMQLATAYQAHGMHKNAFDSLSEALALLEPGDDNAAKSAVLTSLSDTWLSIGDVYEASEVVDTAVDLAFSQDSPLIKAQALNAQGNVLAVAGHYGEALESYAESIQHATTAGDRELLWKTLLNRANAAFFSADPVTAYSGMKEALEAVESLPENAIKAAAYISLSVLAQDLYEYDKQNNILKPGVQATLKTQVENFLNQAAEIAAKLGDAYTAGDAYGRLGSHYELQKEHDQALKFTRKGIFYAAQREYPVLLYRGHWQLARLLNATQQETEALGAYRLAIKHLKPIQQTLDLGYREPRENFDEAVRPVYYELAGLLLEQATKNQDTEERQTLLQEARAVVEQMKVAELENYLQDDCVTALQNRATGLSHVDPKTAVLYPLPLEDRLVLLLSVQGKISQYSVDVSRERLNAGAYTLRLRLQTRPNNRFLYQAKELYDWMIRPILTELRDNKIDTLVVVPDGSLRLVPFSSLYDGEKYLVEEFAIAASPGLTLTEPHSIQWKDAQMLLVGLSDGVQNYSPLPNVPKELSAIEEIIQGKSAGSNKLLNQQYSIKDFSGQLSSTAYTVVHLATHGEFNANPDETYLLTYGEKIHMDKLQEIIGVGRFRENPLELLTLSACKTAVGDDRAALGLAGVAVKAGARSALASLWFVDDEATSLIVTDFYRQLVNNPGLSKAQALRRSQKALLEQKRYWHPAYWAAFLLIGNWL